MRPHAPSAMRCADGVAPPSSWDKSSWWPSAACAASDSDGSSHDAASFNGSRSPRPAEHPQLPIETILPGTTEPVGGMPPASSSADAASSGVISAVPPACAAASPRSSADVKLVSLDPPESPTLAAAADVLCGAIASSLRVSDPLVSPPYGQVYLNSPPRSSSVCVSSELSAPTLGSPDAQSSFAEQSSCISKYPVELPSELPAELTPNELRRPQPFIFTAEERYMWSLHPHDPDFSIYPPALSGEARTRVIQALLRMQPSDMLPAEIDAALAAVALAVSPLEAEAGVAAVLAMFFGGPSSSTPAAPAAAAAASPASPSPGAAAAAAQPGGGRAARRAKARAAKRHAARSSAVHAREELVPPEIAELAELLRLRVAQLVGALELRQQINKLHDKQDAYLERSEEFRETLQRHGLLSGGEEYSRRQQALHDRLMQESGLYDFLPEPGERCSGADDYGGGYGEGDYGGEVDYGWGGAGYSDSDGEY